MYSKLRHKGIKKRYKRIMATVAGAAVISSAMLPGMPFSKAQASPAKPDDTFSRRAAVSHSDLSSKTAANPVKVARDNAADFGFDANSDSFSLLSNSGRKAVVQVHSQGQTFKVDLYLRNGQWVITTIRGIGDSNHPATYTPADMFYYQPGTIYQTLAANQHILFSSTAFNDWSWHKSTYPRDMSLGILLKNPRQTDISSLFPSSILGQMDNIDFSTQFVLYAHLGSVADKGYGIGISKIAQTGNDLTVTVRTLSPLVNTALSPSKADDFVPVDLASLDFGHSIHITFVDQYGTVLGNNTIWPR